MSLNIKSYQKELLNLKLDESLNRKLIQNENKLLSLFVIPEKKREFHSIDEKAISRNKKIEKKKFLGKKKKIINLTKANSTSYDDNNSYRQQTAFRHFSPRSNLNNYYDYDKSPRSYRNIIKVNQNLKKFKNRSNKSNKSTFSSAPKYKRRFNLNLSNNCNKNKKRQNTSVNSKKYYNNSTSNDLHYNTVDYCSKSDRYYSPPPKNTNLEEMIIRFKIDEDKKNEWIKSQKKKKEEEERKICPYAPKINKKSKKINLKFKDDFFGRQKLKDEQKKKKEEKLIAFLNKKKEDEINKSKFLKKKKNIKIKRINSVEKDKKSKINNTINKLYKWDEKRKEKINEIKKKDNEKLAKNTHIPKINNRSSSMASLKNKQYSKINTFDRLAKLDPETVEKKKLLVELYTPNFSPRIYTKRKQKEEDKEIHNKRANEENTRNEMETKGIINLSNKYINNDDVQELYRNAVFQSRKKNKI